MEEEKKNMVIRCRVSPEVHKAWIEACEKNAHNGSALLRRFIEEYIEKSQREEKD